MQRPLKMIGVVSIVALTLAAVAESSAQFTSNLPDKAVCRRALNSERSGWVKESFYTEEAARRSLTVDACCQLIAQSATTGNPPASADTGTSKQRALLEAATYFITGLDIDASNGDVVSDNQIALCQYPVVVYRDKDRCPVRVRTTTKPYTIWQFDFCKITNWHVTTEFGTQTAWFDGEYTAICIYRDWDRNENYTGYISPIAWAETRWSSRQLSGLDFRVWHQRHG